MIKKWLNWINLGLLSAVCLILLWAAFMEFNRLDVISYQNPEAVRLALPKNTFVQPQEAYDSIGEPFFTLKYTTPSLQLPDLKPILLYYGKNGRPDASEENTLLHFAVTSTKLPVSIAPKKKLYLKYDKKQSPPRYIFSPDNAETPLWITAKSQGNEALVQVRMRNEYGDIIATPEANASFTIPEKEYVRFGGAPWEIGKWRVDGTLLARQKARWFGKDVFLEKHGGPEYAEYQDKQRIDFGEGGDIYSVYVGPNDPLAWDGERWKEVKPGPDSLGRPLLVVKKVDERILTFELWDVEGKGKVILNLLKTSEAMPPQHLEKIFKFVGARTRSQFVFEVNKERVLLSPHDWLIFTQNSWHKLSTPQDIDDYVNRKLIGPLFVFDGIERKDDKQFIMGTVFNTSRTDAIAIELPIQQGGNNTESVESAANSQPSHPELRENRVTQAISPEKIKQAADNIIKKVMQNK